MTFRTTCLTGGYFICLITQNSNFTILRRKIFQFQHQTNTAGDFHPDNYNNDRRSEDSVKHVIKMVAKNTRVE